jgi:hypothetical protein
LVKRVQFAVGRLNAADRHPICGVTVFPRQAAMRTSLVLLTFIWLALCGSVVAPSAAVAGATARVGPGAWTIQVDIPEAVTAALRGNEPRAWLNIRGLRVPGGVTPIVNVFANLPPGTTAVPTDDPHYVGYVANVPPKTTSPGEIAVLSGGTLDATKALNRLAPSDRRIAITLAPADGGRADAALSADAVYFTTD